LTAAKFEPLLFSVTGFALSSGANIFIIMILYDFCFLSALFVLCNRIRTGFGKQNANRESVCASDNCQWCVVPSSAGAAISLDGYLPQIPRRE
jgi:hypothetical protein